MSHILTQRACRWSLPSPLPVSLVATRRALNRECLVNPCAVTHRPHSTVPSRQYICWCTDFMRWTALKAQRGRGVRLVPRPSCSTREDVRVRGCRFRATSYESMRDATATCKRDCVRERVASSVAAAGREKYPGALAFGAIRQPATKLARKLTPPDARVRVPLRSPGTVVRLGGVVFADFSRRAARAFGPYCTLVCTVALGQSLKLAIITSGTPHSTHTT